MNDRHEFVAETTKNGYTFQLYKYSTTEDTENGKEDRVTGYEILAFRGEEECGRHAVTLESGDQADEGIFYDMPQDMESFICNELFSDEIAEITNNL